MATPNTRGPGRPPGMQGDELLATARDAFLEHGFEGTTMHDIAGRAGVSKSSLYREQGSKDALFVAVVTDWTRQGQDAMSPHLDALLAAPDLATALHDFVEVLTDAVLSPQVMRMRRLVAAESDRFPDVAAQYLETSWHVNITALADTMSTIAERGDLDLDEPHVAAEQLVWLAVGGPLNAATLTGAKWIASERDAARIDAAVQTFIARYGT